MSEIAIVRDAAALRQIVAAWRAQGVRIALVPTMGALHDGHMALVREARAHAGRVVVSVFVNPTQFAPHEDFSRYPRDLEGDRARLEQTGSVDAVYAPSAADMYPEGFATKVSVEGPGAGLESDVRPHFFAGVATVVAKLLLQCRPDCAIFGEKDYQQLLVVKRLVRDLDLGVEIVGIPVQREAGGLALSSRNAYLTPEQRKIASMLHRVLDVVAERARTGRLIPEAEAEGAAALLDAGFDRVDYVAIRDAETLHALRELSAPARVLAAAWLGTTRLIDNKAV